MPRFCPQHRSNIPSDQPHVILSLEEHTLDDKPISLNIHLKFTLPIYPNSEFLQVTKQKEISTLQVKLSV